MVEKLIENMVLHEIDERTLRGLKNYWRSGMPVDALNLFCRVENPLEYAISDDRVESYYAAFNTILEGLSDPRLNVRTGSSQWRRLFPLDPSENIRLAAEFASQDRRKVHYLEVLLMGSLDHNNSPIIEFIERNGKIIGYDVRIPNAFKHMVHINGGEDYWERATGLWMPPGYR